MHTVSECCAWEVGWLGGSSTQQRSLTGARRHVLFGFVVVGSDLWCVRVVPVSGCGVWWCGMLCMVCGVLCVVWCGGLGTTTATRCLCCVVLLKEQLQKECRVGYPCNISYSVEVIMSDYTVVWVLGGWVVANATQTSTHRTIPHAVHHTPCIGSRTTTAPTGADDQQRWDDGMLYHCCILWGVD